MKEKQYKKLINQLNRTRKIPSLDTIDKKTLEEMRKKYYDRINKIK